MLIGRAVDKVIHKIEKGYVDNPRLSTFSVDKWWKRAVVYFYNFIFRRYIAQFNNPKKREDKKLSTIKKPLWITVYKGNRSLAWSNCSRNKSKGQGDYPLAGG